MEVVADELTCCICCEMFREPVMLDCMHHFCRKCIVRCWKGPPPVSCPQCRRQFNGKNFRANYLVAGVVERVRGANTQDYRLRLQKQLNQVLTNHREQVDKFVKMMKRDEDRISGIKTESADLEHRVKADFEKMHLSLRREEETLLAQLRQDTDAALDKVGTHIQQLQTAVDELQHLISSTHGCLEQLKTTVLVETRGLVASTLTLSAPGTVCKVGSEPDVSDSLCATRYTGPLQHIIWKKVYRTLEPAPAQLTFNPATAHPSLALSDDLTSVWEVGNRCEVPDNPERFDKCVNVMAAQGFTSGRHYWEVGVGGKTKWDLGVARESVDRKTVIKANPSNGYWTLRLRDGDQFWAGTLPWKRLPIPKKPRRIGLFLDYEDGRLSFYNADDMSHMLTFRQSFTQKLVPFFSTCFSEGGLNSEPLQLIHFSP